MTCWMTPRKDLFDMLIAEAGDNKVKDPLQDKYIELLKASREVLIHEDIDQEKFKAALENLYGVVNRHLLDMYQKPG